MNSNGFWVKQLIDYLITAMGALWLNFTGDLNNLGFKVGTIWLGNGWNASWKLAAIRFGKKKSHFWGCFFLG